MRLPAVAIAAALPGALLAAGYPPLQRAPILDQSLTGGVVRHVKGATIRFAPGQPTGRHRHPVPVVGQVTEGRFVFQIEGGPRRILNTGDGFYEPAGVTIRQFDNASPTAPAAITAFYLLDRADTPLIEMLRR